MGILRAPQVLFALNPLYAAGFLYGHPMLGFFALGGVVLAVTGAEALYADMGHFGALPVRLAWSGLVLPALTLNYFGQGALLLVDAKAVENPFYLLAPAWALYPLVALSTVATIIASQAVISGAFSITQQAMQLGYAPRMELEHTSRHQMGQIYVPAINRALFLGVVALVLGFGSSTNLAAAYGIAVTGTMAITTVLAFVVARRLWKWSLPASVALFGAFLLVDVGFFCANLVKIVEGGWFPLAFGGCVFLFMSTWKRGRELLTARLEADSIPLDAFVESASHDCAKVPGLAIFLTANPGAVPHALLHSMKHYKSLHEHVMLLNVTTLDIPHVQPMQRLVVEPINSQFWMARVYFGFMDEPDLPEALEWSAEQGLPVDMMDTSFFLGRETLLPQIGTEMALWREKLFATMYRNAGGVVAYFRPAAEPRRGTRLANRALTGSPAPLILIAPRRGAQRVKERPWQRPAMSPCWSAACARNRSPARWPVRRSASRRPTLAPELVEIGALPHYNMDLEDAPPAEWVAFRKRMQAAEAVLFATPEFNRSVPGTLKNAIDVGSRPYGKSVWTASPAP